MSYSGCGGRGRGIPPAARRALRGLADALSVGAHGLVSVTPDRIADVRASDPAPAGSRVPWMSSSRAPSASRLSCLPDCELGHDPVECDLGGAGFGGSRRADSNSAPQRWESWSVRFETARNLTVHEGSGTADQNAQAIFRGLGPNQAQIERQFSSAPALTRKRIIDYSCGFSPWRDPDSNRGHHDFQSCALPTELSRQRARRLAPRLLSPR
jgi:hypothetical protein